jgi:hypothetical protein
MRSEFQIDQFSRSAIASTIFGEKRQPDEAGNVAISQTLTVRDRGQRSRSGGNEFLEPPMGSCDRLEQRSISLNWRYFWLTRLSSSQRRRLSFQSRRSATPSRLVALGFRTYPIFVAREFSAETAVAWA